MAVQAYILKRPGSGMQLGRVQKPMSQTWNGHEYKRWRVSLDTSFACNREKLWSQPFVQIVFQGSTVSCKHIETIWVVKLECMVHVRPALCRPSLLKVDTAFVFKFISSSRLPPFSKPPLLIVLLIANSLLYNQKTVAGGRTAVFSPRLFPPIQLSPSLGFRDLNLSV